MKFIERLTDLSRQVLIRSEQEARSLGSSSIGTEHLLLSMLGSEGLAMRVLTNLGITYDEVRLRVSVNNASVQVNTPEAERLPFTPRLKHVLEFSLREALMMGHSSIEPEHILIGLIREVEGIGAQLIVSFGVDLQVVRLQVTKLIFSSET